jgi:hypothetical protein
MGKLLCYVLVGVWLCAALGCGRSVPGVPIDPVPDNVPNLYRTLYRELESELSLLNPVFENLWGRKSGTAVFGVELPAAAGRRDARLPGDEQLPSAALTLDRLQSLGAKMVGLNVLYPVLTRDFPQSALYRDFYRSIAGELRRRGLLLVVAMGVVPREPESNALPAGLAGVNRARFNAGLREMAEQILADLRPDYLTVLSEPDTVAQSTGLAFPPAEFAATVRHVVQGLDAGSAKLGAGAGSWAASEYLKALGAIPELYYLDLHIHPVRYGFASDRLAQAAETARSRGKKISIGAAWLQKESRREFGRLSRPESLAREVFSFWHPLDRRFVEMVVGIAHRLEAEFCIFSRTEYLFAAIEHSEETGRLPPAQLLQMIDAEAAARIAAGKLTPTGERFKDLTAD